MLGEPMRLPWEDGFFQALQTTGLAEGSATLVEAIDRRDTLKRACAEPIPEVEIQGNDEGFVFDPHDANPQFIQDEQDERLGYIVKFKDWVVASKVDSILKAQIIDLDEGTKTQAVADALGERSTSTLRSRVSTLTRLQDDLGKNPLDVTESELYKVFCRNREENAAPTRSGSTLQAARFSAAVCGSVKDSQAQRIQLKKARTENNARPSQWFKL